VTESNNKHLSYESMQEYLFFFIKWTLLQYHGLVSTFQHPKGEPRAALFSITPPSVHSDAEVRFSPVQHRFRRTPNWTYVRFRHLAELWTGPWFRSGSGPNSVRTFFSCTVSFSFFFSRQNVLNIAVVFVSYLIYVLNSIEHLLMKSHLHFLSEWVF